MKNLSRLAHLLGLSRASSGKVKAAEGPRSSVPTAPAGARRASASGPRKQKANPKEPAMKMKFEHLNPGADESYREQNEHQQTTHSSDDAPAIRTHIASQHSRGHNVAVSAEAADSPVLAVQLLNDTDLTSSKIRARLREEPESLSVFTRRFMKDNEPGWEFMDDDEKAASAQQYALTNGDRNGYLASKDTAVSMLKKMEEPLTEDEIDAVQEKARLMRNAENPDTPDNVAARQLAEEVYQQQMAQAIVARNESIRATGVALPGDSRRADGRPVAPSGEVALILSKLKAGVPADALMSAR